MSGFAAAARVLDDAVDAGAFPAAVAEVGAGSAPLWRHAAGRLSREAGSPPATVETVFDLASLTKVVATTTLAMRHVDAGLTPLDLPIAEALRTWRGADREGVTVRDLLEHASGLTAHLPFFRDHVGRAEFEPAICRLPLEYAPRGRSVYSDLGFMLLGFILADRDPDGADLAARFDALAARRGWGDLRFRPPAGWRPRTAPTERCPWRGQYALHPLLRATNQVLGEGLQVRQACSFPQRICILYWCRILHVSPFTIVYTFSLAVLRGETAAPPG